MTPKPLNCAACRAPLPAPDDSGTLVCSYCGQTHDMSGHRLREPAEEPPAVTSGGGCAVSMIVLTTVVMPLVMAGIGVAVALLQSTGQEESPLAPLLAPLAAAVEDTRWDSVGGPPVIAVAGGKEVVLGRVRVGMDFRLYVDAYATADGARVWRAGPFATYSDAYQAVWFSLVGDRVAISDLHGKVHLVDLATGEERGVVALTDRVKHLCARDGGVRAEQVDDKTVQIDVHTAAVQERKVGAACDTSSREPKGLKVPGMEVRETFAVGALQVAYGKKHPGTPTPKLAAVEGGKVRWEAWVPSVDPATVREEHDVPVALHGDRLYTVYGVGQEGWRATAFDVQSGARVWESELRGIFAVDWIREAVATDTRVVIVRMSSVDVLDARDGKLVATLGKDPYDR
jgi:hypothetical protein